MATALQPPPTVDVTVNNTNEPAVPIPNADEPWNLCFKNLSKVVYDKHVHRSRTVLTEVSGFALPGEVVGILGLSGSGKTTLLRVLGGRDPARHTGTVYAKGVPLNTALRRRIAFIPQYEAFLPSKTLTPRQQLTFIAKCRTTDDVSSEKIQEMVQTVLLQLNILHRADSPLLFLSGGERKRVSIGCELLTNPKVLLIDEATSNLDSASVSSFLALARSIAVKNNIPVMMTIHQPTCSTFFSFDRIMLMFCSRIVFFGKPIECKFYFQRFNLGVGRPSPVSPLVSPYPFTGEGNYAEDLIQFLSNQQANMYKGGESDGAMEDPYNTDLEQQSAFTLWEQWKLYGNQKIVAEINNLLGLPPDTENKNGKNWLFLCTWLEYCPALVFSGIRQLCTNISILCNMDEECKPPGSRWRRIGAITERSLGASFAAAFTMSSIGHTLLMAFLVGLCWFQMDMRESTVPNYGSFVTFIVTYYFFSGIKCGILLYFPERAVYRSERLSGTIDAFSMLFGRWLSLLPIRIILPTVFIIISYFMAISHPKATIFFQLSCVTILSQMTGESIGLVVATTTDSVDAASSNGIVIALVSLLLGGGFVRLIPDWLVALSNASAYKYLYDSMVLVVFGAYSEIPCDEEGGTVSACFHHDQIPMHVVLNNFHVKDVKIGNCMIIIIGYNAAMFVIAYFMLVLVDNKRSNL